MEFLVKKAYMTAFLKPLELLVPGRADNLFIKKKKKINKRC